MNRNLVMLLGAGVVLYLVTRPKALTPAQLMAQVERDLEPLRQPIVTAPLGVKS